MVHGRVLGGGLTRFLGGGFAGLDIYRKPFATQERKQKHRPSIMPKPDRRMGTSTARGEMVSVVYEYPIGVSSCYQKQHQSPLILANPRRIGFAVGIRSSCERLTVPLDIVWRHPASASHPTISAISWTRAFVSRALVLLDRNWESLARRQGCWETCTLAGKGIPMSHGLCNTLWGNG